MGTRNLTCVWADGDFRVAQYGQWDGYPGGAGVHILEFLRKCDLRKLKKNALKTKWVDDEEVKQAWNDAGADPNSEWVSMDVSKRFGERHPYWSRDTGYKIINMVYEKPLRLTDSRSFATDSLFCEWAYVVDLDGNALEVYKGFNETVERPGKFANITKEGNPKYKTVQLVKSYSLDSLPDKESFLKDFEEKDEE